MFSVYFSVCLRAIIAHLVPERDKGKAFGFVALIQNLDVVIGTIACVEIYQVSLHFFPGFVFIFGVITRVIALILILIQACCVNRTPQLSIITPSEEPLLDAEASNENDDEIITA